MKNSKQTIKKTKMLDMVIIAVLLLCLIMIVLFTIKNSSKPQNTNEFEYTTLDDLKNSRLAVLTGSVQDKIREEQMPNAKAFYYNNVT